MKHGITAVISFAVACLAGAPALAQEAPDALVKRVATEVTSIIKSDKDIQAGDRQKVKDVIETTALTEIIPLAGNESEALGLVAG